MTLLKSDRTLALLTALIVFLSVMFLFVSNHYESRVMGDAALGLAVYAPPRDSPEWLEKKSLRLKADCFSNFSILLSFLAVLLDLYLAFRKSKNMCARSGATTVSLENNQIGRQ